MILAACSYVLQKLFYQKLFYWLPALFLVIAGISYFVGNTAIVERGEFAVVSFAALSRLSLTLFMVLVITFSIGSSIEQNEMSLLVSRPISRNWLIVAHFFAYSVLALFGVFLSLVMLMMIAPAPEFSILVWAGGLSVEQLLVVSFAIFATLSLGNPVPAAAITIAWYAFGRLQGLFTGLADSATSDGWAASTLAFFLQALSWLIPRLDLMAASEYALNGISLIDQSFWVMVQAFVYLSLILIATCLDINRKSF